ncbi:integrating conjugative element relaxase (TIGR03760 family) [Pseudomonas sp. SJZ103]|uniref:MobH family relaxase n=1 Tax=unclassified Pseudomonas TaxID=196821 RepID=UPI00119E9248|nr:MULTISPECIES: MobH family relaxase [unclassified Pseudomonas]MBB6290635.1 integrating conjugative element relaxase (TIGR03760 family) [Pseudomonas sp. SJZ073]MBB6315637.1 integrating conjugative element relaxase (TIGR03760 family) [Pseudomonas sp. JAI120]TWC63085.1 integrating conjugative element relaxase (TIGR03760 family) [Pseudomonas sp. SJZ103]TWC80226.1 integrating conjugative element relaxase (TIGR03760 family) [Pseudomonas sp. SJZ094]
MLSLFRHKKRRPPPPPTVNVAEGYLPIESAHSLLAAEHRRQLLDRIWQYTALSHAQFIQLYLNPIHRYAEQVQQLPASETHHHAYLGGMLDHGLELVACSLKLRQSYLLPSGAAPEDQAAQTDAWSAGIAYGALLHDIGKIAVDLQVERQDGRPWHPWQGPLDQPYRFRYVKGRDYHLHGAAAGLLYTHILDRPILDWLSGFPLLWASLLYVLAGQYERAGVLGELVIQADRVSTAQNIGGNPNKALQAPIHSLQHHLISGLRHLVQHELKLNQPGAAGWLTQDALWLVSKTVTDKLRAYLLSQAIEGIPSSNIAVFDELQSHGLVESTPEGKAIWTALVAQGNWEQTFTFLRFQPALIWGNKDRPEAFNGTVSIAVDENQPNAPVSPVTPKAVNTKSTQNPSSQPDLMALEDADYLSTLLDMFELGEHGANDAPSESADDTSTLQSDNPGQAFLNWVKEGILSHKLIINDSKAKIHTVGGTVFLVTPGLFHRYVQEFPAISLGTDSAGEEWRWVQKQFEKLKIHQKRDDGLNIWICQVEGLRKKGTLKGYLLKNPAILFEAGPIPTDNPFLKIEKA